MRVDSWAWSFIFMEIKEVTMIIMRPITLSLIGPTVLVDIACL